MYLQCPKCLTVYAVNAAMLRDGQGEVRCGACLSIFDALAALSDEIPQAGVDAANASAKRDDEAQNQDHTEDEPAPFAARLNIGDGQDSGAVLLDTFKVETPRTAQRAKADDVPLSLREDWQRLQTMRATRLRNISLGLVTLILLAGLGLQYMWFEPEDLLRRFPQARAGVETFCKHADCLLPSTREPAKIQLLSRAVRAHPDYEGALLVSAMFSNKAAWAQPFPDMKFSLYNVNGLTIASRVFSPEQYLAGALPGDALLPPGQPVQISLEILAPEEAAVSFEFTFL